MDDCYIIYLPLRKQVLDINSKEMILKSQKYIEKHLDEKLSLNEIARRFGYSEYHFSRLFSEYAGISVMEYVKRRRLVRAAEEIIDGRKIIDAAFKYAYESHSGFTKAFKKEFGYSPSLLSGIIMQVKDITGGSNMSKLFIRQSVENETKEKLFSILLECININHIDCNMSNIDKAYKLSNKAYEGLQRYSGEEYIIHPLNVAIILADIGAEEKEIISGLMCDILKKTMVDIKELEEELSADVMLIVQEVNGFGVTSETDNDNVLLVKLAERLHNMRTLKYMDISKWRLKAKETIDIYIPIARRLRNDALVEEMNKLVLDLV